MISSLLRVYARVVQTSALKIAESFTRALNSGESSEDKKSETVASLLLVYSSLLYPCYACETDISPEACWNIVGGKTPS